MLTRKIIFEKGEKLFIFFKFNQRQNINKTFYLKEIYICNYTKHLFVSLSLTKDDHCKLILTQALFSFGLRFVCSTESVQAYMHFSLQHQIVLIEPHISLASCLTMLEPETIFRS